VFAGEVESASQAGERVHEDEDVLTGLDHLFAEVDGGGGDGDVAVDGVVV